MPKINTNREKIQALLTRGVTNVYPDKKYLENLLSSGKRLTLYLGIDPTAPTLHLGSAVIIEKLRQFQELGHQIILLIGDYTAMIGDPTDKKATRRVLTREEVLANAKDYKKQISKIINFSGINKAQLKYNSQWFSKMNFADVLQLTTNFTVQQLLDRDMFAQRMFGSEEIRILLEKSGIQRITHKTYVKCRYCNFVWPSPIQFINNKAFDTARVENNTTTCPHCKKNTPIDKDDLIQIKPKPIYLQELLYPLMQAYDSVAMQVDGEIGGNDQTFNMLAGRTLMKSLLNKEKFVLTTKLLTDDQGVKMGKTEGNMAMLNETAEEMFGKIMSWTDGMILPGLELCTRLPMEEITKIEKEMKQGANPKTFKILLAKEIIKIFHSTKAANEAEVNFNRVFAKKEMPEEIPIFSLKSKNILPADLLVELKFVSSKSEGKRLVEGGGLKINQQKVSDWQQVLNLKSGDIIQAGKRKFGRVS